MARRSEHSQEQIKEMVLNAAESIVVNHGIHALTVRKIAVDIGYTVGSIYMVFANMQDLITHIKLRTLEQLIQHLQVDDTLPAEQQLRQLGLYYLDFAEQHFNRWEFVFDAVDPDNPLPASYRQKLEQLFQPLEIWLARLQPQADPVVVKRAAQGLWSALHGICLLHLNGSFGHSDVYAARQAVQLVVDNFIRGWQV